MDVAIACNMARQHVPRFHLIALWQQTAPAHVSCWHVMRALRLCIALLATAAFPCVGTFRLVPLPDPVAKCNDGSPYMYYARPATRALNQDRWILHLQGGGWCYDAASCSRRWGQSPELMSSKYAPLAMTAGGLLSDDVPAWHWTGAHKVYLPYCSSDAWMGSREAGSETFGWHFRGHDILRGVLRRLVGTGQFTGASEVLLSGCSAGARGLMVHLDLLRVSSIAT